MWRGDRWTAVGDPVSDYDHDPVPDEIVGYAHLVERYWETGESVDYLDGAVTNDAFRDDDRVVKDVSFSALPALLTVYKAGRSLADLVVGPLQGRRPCIDLEYLSTDDRAAAEEAAAESDVVDGPDVFWRDGGRIEMEYLPDEPVPDAVRENSEEFSYLLGEMVGGMLRDEDEADWATRESRPENFMVEYSPIDLRYMDDKAWNSSQVDRITVRRIDNEYGTADATPFDREMQTLTLLSGMKNLPPAEYRRFRDGV
ncbi:MAG: hypothetical protein ABEI97_04435, partial [Candidatus Nanohaloarchaea archaeon]